MKTVMGKILHVEVNPGAINHIPQYIHLMHRHLEKEGGKASDIGANGRKYTAPVDLMKMVVPPGLLQDVEEVILVYKKS